MSRKDLSPESLFTGKHGERLSTHTHAFGTYYVIRMYCAVPGLLFPLEGVAPRGCICGLARWL